MVAVEHAPDRIPHTIIFTYGTPEEVLGELREECDVAGFTLEQYWPLLQEVQEAITIGSVKDASGQFVCWIGQGVNFLFAQRWIPR